MLKLWWCRGELFLWVCLPPRHCGVGSSSKPLTCENRWESKDMNKCVWLKKKHYKGETLSSGTIPIIAANDDRLTTRTGSCCGEFLLWWVPAIVKGLNYIALLPISYNLLIAACSHNAVGSPGKGIRRTGMHHQLTLQQTRKNILKTWTALASNWPLYSAITMRPVWGPSVKSNSWGLLCLRAPVCRKVERNQSREMHQLFHSFNWERRLLTPVRRPVLLTRLGCTLNTAEYIWVFSITW